MASTSPSHPPAMTDVAAVAGVSHQTVSRVLNNSGSVRPETRERVLAAIKQLGYRRNETARALARRQSNMLGILTTNLVQRGPASTLLSTELTAKQRGYFVTVAALSEFTDHSVKAAMDHFMSLGVLGVIVIAPVREVADSLTSIDLGIPIVAASSSWTDTPSQLVHLGFDQREGAKLAVDHLTDLGCRSIIHAAGPENWFDAEEREIGWVNRMKFHGLALPPVLRGEWTAVSGYEMGRKLVASGLPDAIFAANDLQALGMLKALHEAGVRVPHDTKVIGFDDEDGSAFYVPALTTIRQDFARLGLHILDALNQALLGEPIETSLIKPELLIRASTQP